MPTSPYILVLGTAQDAGFPQAGCRKACCRDVWNDPQRHRMATSLALVDPVSQQRWFFDMTPDFKGQLRLLDTLAPSVAAPGIAGIFLTHGHIGHYTGLMHLGHEVMGARQIPVFSMPRMQNFLTKHGPWSQLVSYQNIKLMPMTSGTKVVLNERLSVTPLLVPHRDEFTETVGFVIKGPTKTALFIPDIDKWERWQTKIEEVLAKVDVAYLDGTFFDAQELPGRNMSEIPHPFIKESMKRFAPLPDAERSKIRFIHLNHSNPALDASSQASQAIKHAGFCLAQQAESFAL